MRILVATLLAALCAAGPVAAQPWPSKPVRIVVPYPAGGSGDIVTRLVAQKMSEGLGQQFIVDNRAGANGNIGTDIVAKSAPDGYTLLIATDIQFAISPALGAKLPFDPGRDFNAVSLIAFVDLVLAAHPSLPANNVQELVALAKSRPGTINYASTGPGSTHHLSIELLKLRGGINLVHVPYKGAGQALPDLISGQVQLMQLGIPQTLPHLKSGRVKALGVGSARRLAVLPDVPTVAEQGFPGYEANNSWCLYAPAGTPKDVIARLHAEVVRIVTLADVRERFAASGLEPVGSTPEQLNARMREDRTRWEKLIREAGIRVEQ